MNKEDIFKQLCAYDERNPFFEYEEDPGARQVARVGCFCDNCFYYRDTLAVELLKYIKD